MTNLARIERTKHELGLLSGAIEPWLRRRREDDRDTNNEYLGHHQTQLQSISSVLTESVTFLNKKLAALDPAREAGEVYLECRDIDETIVWVQRVWEYFKERFDQRDEQRMGPLLKAADEVVYSCYSQVFVQAAGRPGVEKRPPPLAFVEPQYSPAAVETDRPLPPDLRLSAEVPFVSEFIKTLPVAVVSLPPWCVDAPWWLIYLAHEAGHHVLHDLKLTAHFRNGIEAAALKKLPAGEAASWGRWSEEIFADIFSVLMVGEWAVWAVAVDLRPDPPTFGRHVGVELSGEDGHLLWVPPGFAHGMCVLGGETADFFYKTDTFYNPAGGGGIFWADPELAIRWPVEEPVVSARDGRLPSLADCRARAALRW